MTEPAPILRHEPDAIHARLKAQRPAYWVLRGDSRWVLGTDDEGVPDDALDFFDLLDEILLPDLEEAFGCSRCGYCGAGASVYADGPPEDADCGNPNCDRPDEVRAGCGWPSVDDYGGCHWGRVDWPKEFATTPNPLSWRGSLLSERDT